MTVLSQTAKSIPSSTFSIQLIKARFPWMNSLKYFHSHDRRCLLFSYRSNRYRACLLAPKVKTATNYRGTTAAATTTRLSKYPTQQDFSQHHYNKMKSMSMKRKFSQCLLSNSIRATATTAPTNFNPTNQRIEPLPALTLKCVSHKPQLLALKLLRIILRFHHSKFQSSNPDKTKKIQVGIIIGISHFNRQ